MASADVSGWALQRNGTCLANVETSCGQKQEPFFACCPSGTRCQDGKACCPAGSSDNCTQTLLGNPSCGNKAWDLYDFAQPGSNGYFCCDPLSRGYGESGSVGCLSAGASWSDTDKRNHAKFLSVIKKGVPESAAATSSATAAQTSNASSSSSNAGSSNTAAIAGGVVGGVVLGVLIVGLIWFLLRRAKARAVAQDIREYHHTDAIETQGPPEYTKTPHTYYTKERATTAELPGTRAPGELETRVRGMSAHQHELG